MFVLNQRQQNYPLRSPGHLSLKWQSQLTGLNNIYHLMGPDLKNNEDFPKMCLGAAACVCVCVTVAV